MQALIDYFSTMPSLHRTILLVSGLTIFWVIESAAPLFHFQYKKWKHAGTNIFFTLTTALVNLPLAFLLVMTSDWVIEQQIGVLQWISMPLWAQMIVGLLLLDLVGAWLIHFTEHKVKFMWKFHLIHHTDQAIDTTSGNRHHPGESVFRFVFTCLAVVVAGAPMWLVLMYQTLSVIFTQFNHSNWKFPAGLDKVLSYVLVTPGMHRVHHHYRQPYSDMNYGNLFSIWDRMFGTYVEVDNEKLTYGVDTHMDVSEVTNIWTLLKVPFQKYRPHIEYKEKEEL